MELVKPVEPVLWASIVELVIGGTGYGTVEALLRREIHADPRLVITQVLNSIRRASCTFALHTTLLFNVRCKFHPSRWVSSGGAAASYGAN